MCSLKKNRPIPEAFLRVPGRGLPERLPSSRGRYSHGSGRNAKSVADILTTGEGYFAGSAIGGMCERCFPMAFAAADEPTVEMKVREHGLGPSSSRKR